MLQDFALIARGDRGGIAAQTWELARHLHPCRVLLIDLGGKGRGPTDPTLYDEPGVDLRVTSGPPDAGDARWLARPGVRSVFAVEGLGSHAVRDVLAAEGARVILQANPELFIDKEIEGVDVTVVLPTPWEAERFPGGTRLLPVPINTAQLAPIPRDPPQGRVRMLHFAGAAFHDRNGTRDLVQAARRLRAPSILGVANRPDLPTRRLGSTAIVRLPDTASYLGQWAPEVRADVFVLPRRYGGLSLPMQEAAACGLPIVTTDLEPQREWVHPAGLVPVRPSWPTVAMKGGRFAVHATDPQRLAQTIERFLSHPELRDEAGGQARAWAEQHSWEMLSDEYLGLLCE